MPAYFSVIYEVDTSNGESVSHYMPRKRHQWQLTESGKTEYSDLGDHWEHGKHRKLVAILNRKDFDAFVSRCNLIADDIETMGSIGAPGFGYGWAPAISFRAETYSAFASAYVTPLIARKTKRGIKPVKPNANKRDFARVRRAVLAIYG